jgi:hypothetical protein
MPVGDLPGWHQIFTDDFTTSAPVGSFPGSAYSKKWGARPDGSKDTSGRGTFYPSKVLSVANGALNMNIHTENGVHMVAAPQTKLFGSTGVGQLYGRYSVRFRSDSLYGYKTAWLLWPDSGVQSTDGEIDFPEGDLHSVIKGYVHHTYATSYSDQDWFKTTTTYTSWHTATIEWTPGKVVFILDGQTIGTSTTRVPNKPMHWTLQTETAMDGPVPSNSTAGNVQVDWVAVWAYAPGSNPTPTPSPAPTQSPSASDATIACSTTGSANPSVSQRGWTEHFGVNVTTPTSVSNAIVAFEVYDPSARKLYTTVTTVSLAAGQTKWVTANWKIPTNQATGTYSFKVLVYGTNWAPLYGTQWQCGSFSVT